MAQYHGRTGHTESVSMGCLPKHAKELNEQFRKKYGVTSAYFDPVTGNAIMEDKNGRRAMTKFRNCIDEGN